MQLSFFKRSNMKRNLLLTLAGVMIVIAVGGLWWRFSSNANTGYQEGLQHLYPYYVPDTERQTVILEEIYTLPLQGATDLLKVQNYVQQQLRFNEMGSVIFGTALHQVSELDPDFNQDNRCGIAGWQCDDERWQRFLTFTDIYYLDATGLKAQLLFINFELNALGTTIGSQGDYQAVYDELHVATDFDDASRAFQQDYLEQSVIDLTALARTLYGYGTVEPEPTPPEPEPTPTPPAPPIRRPAPTVNITQPTVAECRKGQNNSGYIADNNGVDSQGRFMLPLEVVTVSNPNRMTTTLLHRCLKPIVEKLLSDYNRTVSQPELKLGGWGWRSHAKQIALRTQNCAGSDGVPSQYDIWEKPARECVPETARPGKSNHQDGLAIDFYCRGSSVKEHTCGNAYKWLTCNAARYRLIRIQSETWHWYFPMTQNGQTILATRTQQAC